MTCASGTFEPPTQWDILSCSWQSQS